MRNGSRIIAATLATICPFAVAPVTVAAPLPPNGLGSITGLPAATQLHAMRTALLAAPSVFPGRSPACASITPLLASQPGSIIAGNFRDADGACYVWLNLAQSELLTGSEICKTVLHEVGHLTDLTHSADPNDVMFAPFRADPIPPQCASPRPLRTARAKRSRGRRNQS